jgi:N utilization substance protein A
MDDMALIASFERITGASAMDVVRDDEGDRLIFIVRPKQLGKAIGRGGANVKAAADVFGRPIDIVEIAETAEEFVKKALRHFDVTNVTIA